MNTDKETKEANVPGSAGVHRCGDGCKHESRGKDAAPVMTEKDVRNLARSGYSSARDRFKTSFVLMNTKTGVVVELRAASPVHACGFIGWRPRNTVLVETRTVEEEKGGVPDGQQPATGKPASEA